ncbi:MAG: D-alanyl-D-alanine carboxypeptidase/D-alanyl-D-alanine-endopeptidase [Bacteroidetes bacterium]|nr:D-alanyl-D-alanine carboxypeptidase/D-alanyl-D-alanine-endopeptidase [Bacteroidota bacterium]
MKRVFAVYLLLASCVCYGQDLKQKLSAAIGLLEKDQQFSHAVISMYVVESKTGRLLYEKNAETGLAPASCQKVITSAAALSLLGKDFRYKTTIGVYKAMDTAKLFIRASGDPTFGSARWNRSTASEVLNGIATAIKKEGVTSVGVDVMEMNNGFSFQPLPDGWVWQDIGNYYGAGAYALNWRENQYNLLLSSGNKEKDPVAIKAFDPKAAVMPIVNLLSTGEKGSGDNAYIYTSPYSNSAYVTGTIPPGENNFSISGAMPDPLFVFVKETKAALRKQGIEAPEGSNLSFLPAGGDASLYKDVYTYTSPTFDSINFWFLRKSVNLFGEAFVKTIAKEKTGTGSTDSGIAIIRNFWDERGIDRSALHIIDGSGLSPANRVTTHALVQVMQFARQQPWYASFYNALPEMNGIKMKDGYIGGARSYTGYIKSKTGVEYTFSFIVNNYDGNAGSVREKMWRILDILK